MTVVSTHTGTTRIETRGGADRVAVRTIAGDTTILTGAGDDHDPRRQRRRLLAGALRASAASTAPGASPTGSARSSTSTAAPASTALELDDTADASDNTGTLERVGATLQLRGLDMAEGVDYTGVERLAIALGAGNDTFTVASTHVFDARRRPGARGPRRRRQPAPAHHRHADADRRRRLRPEVTYGAGNRVLSTGTGADTVAIGSLAPGTRRRRSDGIDALVELEGAGADDTLIVDDTGDAHEPIGYLDARHHRRPGHAKLGVYGTRPDRVEVVAIANVVDGRFTITLGGQTTTELDFDAAASDRARRARGARRTSARATSRSCAPAATT